MAKMTIKSTVNNKIGKNIYSNIYKKDIEIYGPNIWDDTLAIGDIGWTYIGNGIWSADGSINSGFHIENLVDNGSSVEIKWEIITQSSGSASSRVEGTVSGNPQFAIGEYTDEITDTLGYTKTGIVGFSTFIGSIRVIHIKKKILD